MATNHSFDLNDPGNLQKYYSANELKQMTSEEATQKLWNNFCVSTVYEPGSTRQRSLQSRVRSKTERSPGRRNIPARARWMYREP